VKKEPLTLKEISETVEALSTVFRDVVVVERNGRSVIVAREHHAMIRRTSCFCGGEVKPTYSGRHYERPSIQEALTYSTGDSM